MTATDELRRLLDERGVEHFGDGYRHITTFNIHGATMASVTETSTGKLVLRATFETPAQAVEATLERGECKMRLRDDIRGHAYQDTYECDTCGWQVIIETCMDESEPPSYCPNCGRKVVDA